MNQTEVGGVLFGDVVDAYASRCAGSELTVDQNLEREFEARLLETSTLAFRVAYSVLRHREDAEDVAQDAFAQAYRHFGRLRELSNEARGLRALVSAVGGGQINIPVAEENAVSEQSLQIPNVDIAPLVIPSISVEPMSSVTQ